MRIHSVHLKNYRIHRELEVVLDPRRNLVGGANESGKSTLAEAIHRAFFLKAKGNTEQHRAMVSKSGLGVPEVAVRFEVEGRVYGVRKSFGRNGVTLLELPGGGVLRDQEAEEKLGAILKSPTALTGSAATTHWSHLWVWQGTAGRNPGGVVAEVSGTLVQRLQKEGAGAVLQSALDQKVAQWCRERLSESVVGAGKYRAGSAAALAQAALEKARMRLEKARVRSRNLECAMEDVERAGKEQARLQVQGEANRRDEEAYQERAVKCAELSQRRSGLESEWEQRRQALERLRSLDGEIRDLESRIASADRDLAPMQGDLGRLQGEVQRLQWLVETRAGESQECQERASRARLDLQLAAALEKSLGAREDLSRLDSSRRTIEDLKKRGESLEAEWGRLPGLGRKQLEALIQTAGELEKSRAALEALGVKLEWVEGGTVVTAGGTALQRGKPVTLLEAADLEVGGVRIRVSPGAGSGIVELRSREASARLKLEEGLREWNVRDLEEARRVYQRRAELEVERANLEAELRGLKPQQVEAAWKEATAVALESGAGVERLVPGWTGGRLPENREEARLFCRAVEENLRGVEAAEVEARRQMEAAEAERKAMQLVFEQKNAALLTVAEQLKTLQAEHAVRVGQCGDADARGRALSEQERDFQVLKMRLEGVGEELAKLRPAELEQERERIGRVREQLQGRLLELNGTKASAEALLRRDDGLDPRMELAEAEAEHLGCEAQAVVQRRRVGALQLLDKFFSEAEHALSEQLTGPLREKVDGYLVHLFGGAVQTQFQLSEEGLTGVEVRRPELGGAAFGFEVLSTGTQEQIAAAFRLAVAEVLAEEHGGAMPVFLDDAFANSDPDRVLRVNRMLDAAAARGLQVILLSCTPECYTGLGAKLLTLERPSLDPVRNVAVTDFGPDHEE